MTVGSLLARCLATPDRQLELSVRDWEGLLGQARQARLIARLAVQYLENGWMSSVPDGPRQHLAAGLKLANRQQHEVRWEIDRIMRALVKQTGPVVLLKGGAYLIGDLPVARGRLFSDIDILVPRDQIDVVEAALLGAGWICDERDSYNQRYYREWMHEIPPLRHVQRNTYIDLHHTITPPTSRFNVDGELLLERIQPLSKYPGLYVLAPTDMVLHSAVHLFQEGEFGHGLRDLLDLHDLIRHFSDKPGFWDELMDRAERLGLQIPLFHALSHGGRIFGLSAPPHLGPRINAMGPNNFSRSMMAWMLDLALRPDHPSCNQTWTGLARWLLYVRSHALRMPMQLVLPHLVRKYWMRRFPKEV